jgi:hypothetical protein
VHSTVTQAHGTPTWITIGKVHLRNSYEGPQVEKWYSHTLPLTMTLDGGGWSMPFSGKETHSTGSWLGWNLIHRPSSPLQVAILTTLPWPINHNWFPWEYLSLLLTTKHNLPHPTQGSGHNSRYSVIIKEIQQKKLHQTAPGTSKRQ